MNCPICGRWIPAGSARCPACGADLKDPDVLRLIAAPPAPAKAPTGVGEGALANDRFLGMTGAGIADGSSLRRLALAGAALLAIGGLFPLDLDFTRARFPLGALGDGPRAALLVPLILALAGAAVALPRRGQIPPIAVAGLLAAGGLVELTLGLTPLGASAWTPTSLPVLTWLGVATAGVGVSLRILRPTDPWARWIVVAGAAIWLLGGLVPHDDVGPLLLGEMRWVCNAPGGCEGSVHGTAWDAVGLHALVQFLGLALLLPLVLLPLAALLAFRRPTGLWDTAGNTLRAVGFGIVLWLPLVFAIAAFNVWGWPDGRVRVPDHGWIAFDDFSRALLLGRIRLTLLSAGAILWLTAGATALVVLGRARLAARSQVQ